MEIKNLDWFNNFKSDIKKSESKNYTWFGNLKSVDDLGVIEGSAIVYGSEEQPDQSSYKDFFTEDTYIHPEDSFITPLFLEHAHTYPLPIGKAIMFKTQNGWEATAELDMENEKVKSIFPEIKKGGWGFSTGALGHTVKRAERANKTNHIYLWNVGELSITKTPAESRAIVHSVKSMYNEEMFGVVEDEQEDNTYYMLMKIIEMLMSELTKKHLQEILSSELDEIKTLISEIKTATVVNIDEVKKGDDILATDDKTTVDDQQQLTVLKSEKEELNNQFSELQSSFKEKEALLSEKMALLSETEAELESQKSKNDELQNTLTQANEEVEKLKAELIKAKSLNSALAKTTYKL